VGVINSESHTKVYVLGHDDQYAVSINMVSFAEFSVCHREPGPL